MWPRSSILSPCSMALHKENEGWETTVMWKLRKPGDAYIETVDPRTGWRYEVVKSWQQDGSKPYARVFRNVHGSESGMGDFFVGAVGRVIVDFDSSIFEDAQEAGRSLFCERLPFDVDLEVHAR